MNLKKIAFGLLVGTGLVLGGANVAMAQNVPGTSAGKVSAPTTIQHGGFGTNNQVSDIKGIAGTDQSANTGSLISVIKNFLNRMLGIISLVAFAMLLFGGFQMVTAGGDEAGYKKGFTYLKNAALGLVIVGLSYIVIQTVFWLIGQVV